MRRIIIVDDGDTQDFHDTTTGQFVDWDSLVGVRIHHIERDDDDRLVIVVEDEEDEDGESED